MEHKCQWNWRLFGRAERRADSTLSFAQSGLRKRPAKEVEAWALFGTVTCSLHEFTLKATRMPQASASLISHAETEKAGLQAATVNNVCLWMQA
jgi:hypothetical protein